MPIHGFGKYSSWFVICYPRSNYPAIAYFIMILCTCLLYTSDSHYNDNAKTLLVRVGCGCVSVVGGRLHSIISNALYYVTRTRICFQVFKLTILQNLFNLFGPNVRVYYPCSIVEDRQGFERWNEEFEQYKRSIFMLSLVF